jgi:CopG family transcriptional regulator / antitoxin EndoAI
VYNQYVLRIDTWHMHRRINITLPEETVRAIDRFVAKGDRSSFIDRAIQFYFDEINKNQLRDRLKAGALSRAERDLQLAEELFKLDD